MIKYGIKREVEKNFFETIEKVKEEFKKEGFGVLTQIDVKETLKIKLGEKFRNYLILGMCNPKFAFEMLKEEIDIGLLLPCNVIVYEGEEDKTVVSVIDPVTMLDVTGRNDLLSTALIIKEKLEKAFNSI